MSVPGLMDTSDEPESTFEMYGAVISASGDITGSGGMARINELE